MFLIVNINNGEGKVELEKIVDYTHVSLLDIVPKPTKKLFVVGDFVDPSMVDGKALGVIGVSNAPFQVYISINIRRATLCVSFLNAKDLSPENTINSKVIFHLKSDK